MYSIILAQNFVLIKPNVTMWQGNRRTIQIQDKSTVIVKETQNSFDMIYEIL